MSLQLFACIPMHAMSGLGPCMCRYKKRKAECEAGPRCEMGGFTRLLHSGQADDLMDEIPTFVADPLPNSVVEHDWYPVLNRPYAFLQVRCRGCAWCNGVHGACHIASKGWGAGQRQGAGWHQQALCSSLHPMASCW